jgi:8-oxo-dGTP diphosphatase
MLDQDKPYSLDVIEAAGGIVWQKSKAGHRIAIIHRPKYDDWTLPKGKREVGETWQDTAMREVFEEIACEVRIDSFAGGVIYQVRKIPKVVLFWNMTVLKEYKFTPTLEIDELTWTLPKDAIKCLSHENEMKIIQQFL